MEDWAKKLDAFLKFHEYEILKDAGKVSANVAKELAEGEYEKFRVEQDRLFESDFDREVKRVLSKGKSQTETNNSKE
ncbi:MAG: RhuM family protein [Tepidanaerobacteraceae bacterium]|nr:RhuM family protein [Tepidanaerobacteraceae bacterium]